MTFWLYILSFAIALAIAGMVYFLNIRKSRNAGEGKGQTVEEILNMKYASGQISKQQYEERKGDLSYNVDINSPYPAIRLHRIL